jgi:two-component system OmpR family sensor kinase
VRLVGYRPGSRRRRLDPRTWPLRWRLAAVSAGLTLAILMLFGAVVGATATQRIRDDFNNEVRTAAQILAGEFKIEYGLIRPYVQEGARLNDFVLPDDASARVLDVEANVLKKSSGPSNLGPPQSGLADRGDILVATEPVVADDGTLTGYVQYGRNVEHVDDNVERLWLFIVAGVLGGTLLASFAGVAIARRAMRPIASLTSTAREIAATGDPSQRMPDPVVADEVGELAGTLEEMLRSLDAARTEREGAMQRQREFVADASHELRTPLTSVLANLELLQVSLDSSGQTEDREVVDSALRSSRRMSRLVADLLLLARADAGRLDRHRRCDLAEVAGDAAVEAAPLMGDRTLSVDIGQPLKVDGSPDELHRMVLNLLDNAARYTPAGATIELSLHREDGSAVVEVADDGPGIPAELREQVFDRFVRGEGGAADTAGGTGTGLGLAIVSAVASSHDGTVEAAESASGGALIRARIPLADSDESVSRPLKAL